MTNYKVARPDSYQVLILSFTSALLSINLISYSVICYSFPLNNLTEQSCGCSARHYFVKG